MINKAAYDTLKSMSRANWLEQLRGAVRDPEALNRMLGLDPDGSELPARSLREFPLLVPRNWVERIAYGNKNDPLLRQVLPLAAEDQAHAGFSRDPLGEAGRLQAPGLLQKYHGRALLVTTGACAIHCRYCFRRHFPYAAENGARDNWDGALEQLARDPDLSEIILSGGDPLVLADDRLLTLIQRLEQLPQLQRLRIHSRVPVILPERVTDELLQALSRTRLIPVLVIHCNHPEELDQHAGSALERLRQAGIVLLNQSVLLRGINDSWETIAALSERLLRYGVLPYYLHLLDPVDGAAHFHVPMADAAVIMEALRRHLPGYLVPRLVREQAGAPYKLPLL